MSIFLDTGVFVAFHNEQDANHERAKVIISRVVKGEFGAAYTSDYVFDECVTLALARTGRSEVAVQVGRVILGEVAKPFVIILRVGEDAFGNAWGLFPKYSKRGLSFTDCTSLSLMKIRNVDRIASFDSSFDGMVTRIH